MIEQNNQLKKNFEEYDQTKDNYVNEIISNIRENNKYAIEKYVTNLLTLIIINSNYSTPEKIFAYIQELEKQINCYKAREKDYKERIEEKTKQIEKVEKTNQSLKESIQRLDRKIAIASKITLMNEKKANK